MYTFLKKVNARILHGVPEGYDALILSEQADSSECGTTLHIARDEIRLTQLAESVAFFAPEIEIITVPAWDCLPYDRVSPNSGVMAHRIDALTRLKSPPPPGQSRLVITTVSAVWQRVPKVGILCDSIMELEVKGSLDTERFNKFLSANGYVRVEQVMEAGEYAYRGSLIDLYAPGLEEPVRIDLFGDDIESIRTFDPVSQLTTGNCLNVALKPMSETLLNSESISLFLSLIHI